MRRDTTTIAPATETRTILDFARDYRSALHEVFALNDLGLKAEDLMSARERLRPRLEAARKGLMSAPDPYVREWEPARPWQALLLYYAHQVASARSREDVLAALELLQKDLAHEAPHLRRLPKRGE